MGFLAQLFKIAVPMILQNFLTSFVNMLDTVMVGQLGSIDIAAVGLGNQVFFVMNIMMFGICSGGSIFIAQFWGKKDLDGVHRTMGITFCATFVISLIFFLASTFVPEYLLRIYSKDSEVILRGAVYLRAVAPSYFFFGLSFAFAHGIRSTERVKLPMISTAVSVLINCLFNYLLIFGVVLNGKQLIPAMGITGAARATVISRVVELSVLLIVSYCRKYEAAVALPKYFKTQVGFFPRYLRIAIPVLLNESLWGIGTSLQNSIFGHAGTDVLAAFNIQGTISNLIWTFFLGSGNAAAILIGKKIGEQKHHEARSLANKLTVFMIVSAAILGLLLIPLSFTLKYMFKVEPEVLRMAQILLYLTVCVFPLWSINMITVVGICRSGGDTIYGGLIDVGFMWAIALPLGFCAVNLWHLPFWAIFLCVQTECIFKCTFGLLRLKSGKWLHDVTA